MYKVKIVFLYEDSEGDCRWSHQWADWDGIDDVEGILAEYRAKEEKALKEDNIDNMVKYAVIVECEDCTVGQWQCASCECYFNKTDQGDCPYCGSGNFVKGCIDEPV